MDNKFNKLTLLIIANFCNIWHWVLRAWSPKCIALPALSLRYRCAPIIHCEFTHRACKHEWQWFPNCWGFARLAILIFVYQAWKIFLKLDHRFPPASLNHFSLVLHLVIGLKFHFGIRVVGFVLLEVAYLRRLNRTCRNGKTNSTRLKIYPLYLYLVTI